MNREFHLVVSWLCEAGSRHGQDALDSCYVIEVTDAMFVLVNPDMIVNLAGPELLPLLYVYRGGRAGPNYLVIEDADNV